jgi:hypothetical protein
MTSSLTMHRKTTLASFARLELLESSANLEAANNFLCRQYDTAFGDRSIDNPFRGAFVDRPGVAPSPDHLRLFLQNFLTLYNIPEARQSALANSLKKQSQTAVTQTWSALYSDALANCSRETKPEYHRALAKLARSMADVDHVAREP